MEGKEFFLRLYRETQPINEIKKELLLRVLIEFIIEIDFNVIDVDKSLFEIRADGYQLTLLPKSMQNCPIFIEILNNTQIDVQLNQGGEYLYLQPVNDWTDVKKLRSALMDLFYQPIEEWLHKSNGKIKRASYVINHPLEDGVKT